MEAMGRYAMPAKRTRVKSEKEKKPEKKSGGNDNELEDIRLRLEARSRAFEKIIIQLNKSVDHQEH
jgi:hypothetical protein